jgi:hypothetical protein
MLNVSHSGQVPSTQNQAGHLLHRRGLLLRISKRQVDPVLRAVHVALLCAPARCAGDAV